MQINIENIITGKGVCNTNNERHTKSLPFLSVAMPIKGSYSVSIDSSEYINIEAGSAFCAPSNVMQDIFHILPDNGSPMQYKWVFIDAKINNIYRLDDVFSFDKKIDAVNCISISEIINELEKFSTEDILSVVNVNILGYKLIKELLKFAAPKMNHDSDIMPAIEYIRANYNEKITIDMLAAMCGFSKSAFSYQFQKCTGMTAVKFLTDCRLSAASAMLQFSGCDIGEIAEKCGFYDRFYFSKQFSRKYGITPVAYRKKYYQ